MATSPVTLDMSTAQPIQQNPAPVTLDMSTAQPIATLQSGVVDRAIAGANRSSLSSFAPPQTATEHVVDAITGGTGAGLAAWRTAKSLVDSVKNAMDAKKPNEFSQAKGDVQRAVQDFHNRDYRNLAADAGSVVGDAIPVPVVGNTVRNISEGTRPGGDLAGALGQAAGDAAVLVGTSAVPEAAGDLEGSAALPTHSYDPVTGAIKPIPAADAVSATNAAKSGLPEGAAAQTEAPTVQSASPEVQQAIKDSANAVAKSEELQPVPDNTPIRETFNNLRDQFYARSKAGFAQIQEATGVDINQLQQDIRKLGYKISDAVDDPDKVDSLTTQVQAKQAVADKAFADAQAKGINTTQAVTDWKKMNAADEMNAHVVNSTTGRPGVGNGEITDPTKLAPRLDKASVSQSATRPGRLQEFMGNDTANNLADTIEAQRGAIKDFQPTTATGQKALQDLIRPNTGAGKVQSIKQSLGFTPKTNWLSTYSDLNKLSSAEMAAKFGPDAAQARSFVASQARWQLGKMLAKGVGIATITHVTGLDGAALHAIVHAY
jgi:hypothetical protein